MCLIRTYGFSSNIKANPAGKSVFYYEGKFKLYLFQKKLFSF